jgi:hypothetical protein
MHANPTFKHWIHQIHDESIRLRHMTGHVLHERSFWTIAFIVLMLAVLFSLLILAGNNATTQFNDYPLRYMW